MPTSAAGSSPPLARRAPRAQSHGAGGFTLIELIVVIAIIAMATAGVGFALRDSGQATLDREAERLSALLESARSQARANGTAVRWRLTPEGPGAFTFDGLPRDALPNGWLSEGIEALPGRADGTAAAALQLGPDPIIAAQQVVITADSQPGRSVRIATDGLRPFAIVSP